MAYLEFTSYILGGNEYPDCLPLDLSTLVPGEGGFTAGSRNLLKNLVGFMIAAGGWTLAAASGTDPQTYVLTSTGTSGYDALAIELGWDANRTALSARMGTGCSSGTIQNPSPVQLWYVTNGADAATNNTRAAQVYAYCTKDVLSLVTIEATSGFKTGIGPMGLIDRWATVIPTSLTLPAGADRTAIFHAFPTVVGGSSASLPVSGDTVLPSSGLSMNWGPTRQAQGTVGGIAGNGYLALTMSVRLSGLRVYQNYGDSSVSWIPAFLSGGSLADTNTNANEGGTNAYVGLVRQPITKYTVKGTDGQFYADQERVLQVKSTVDTEPLLRGLLPAVLCLGANAGAEFSEVTLGTQTYKRFNLNLGFWPRGNPSGFALRKA